MRTLYIAKKKNGFAYRDASMNGSWIDLPAEIKDAEGIKRFFTEGRDQPIRRQYNPPELLFTDHAGKPQKYYNVKFEADGTATAVTDFDASKKLYMTPHSLWPEADRLAYLRNVSIHIPAELTKLNEVISYVKENEPSLTLEDYIFEANDRSRQAAERLCREHSQTYFPGTSAQIEFEK